MKMALTVWENRISPVADSASQLMTVEMEDGLDRNRRFASFNGESLFERASNLAELEIEIFICGAISSFLATLVQGYGIRVIPFICGDVDEVLHACIAGSLCSPKFIMRGCRPGFAGSGFDSNRPPEHRRRRMRANRKSGLTRSDRQNKPGGQKT